MNNPLQINYWCMGGFTGELPISEAIRHAKSWGLHGIELVHGCGEFAEDVGIEDLQAIKADAEAMGMPLRSLASGHYWPQPLAHPDEEQRQRAVAYTKNYLRAAAALGVQSILVIPGHVAVPWEADAPQYAYADVWAWTTESLRACLPLAEELGVAIALENVWNWFLPDPMAMAQFIDQFDSPAIGAYFDAGNCLINGRAQDWVDILAQRIKAVHVKNFQRQDCAGGLHGFGENLHEGDLDWSALKDALQRIDYSGPITVEMIPFSRLPDLNLPDLALAEKVAYHIQEIWS